MLIFFFPCCVGAKDAVFLLANGATLKNAIIGKDQIEGVHCLGACTIENVWWVDVCEGKYLESYKHGIRSDIT